VERFAIHIFTSEFLAVILTGVMNILEYGTQGYDSATLSPEDINAEALLSRMESDSKADDHAMLETVVKCREMKIGWPTGLAESSEESCGQEGC
jgi:hypothetical protein